MEKIDDRDVIKFDTLRSKIFRWFKGWRYKYENKDYIYFYNKYNPNLIGMEEKFITPNTSFNDSFTNDIY